MQLTGSQRKYLRGRAHHLNPAALVGQKGVTPALLEEIETALDAAELIKIKFVDHKDKESKADLLEDIVRKTHTCPAGMVGHVAVLFRQHKDPEKRRIKLP